MFTQFVDRKVTEAVKSQVKLKNINICDMFTPRWLAATRLIGIN